MDRRRKKGSVWGLVILTAMLLGMSGCGGALSKSDAPVAKPQEKAPSPVYYDFGDVLVPHELKVVRKDSFVFRTSGFSAGVLVMKGRVELNSLIRFFENNMAKDNWTMVSTFKSPRTIMLFHKESRWCIINITEGDFSSQVEIWVAPTVAELGSGLLK